MTIEKYIKGLWSEIPQEIRAIVGSNWMAWIRAEQGIESINPSDDHVSLERVFRA